MTSATTWPLLTACPPSTRRLGVRQDRHWARCAIGWKTHSAAPLRRKSSTTPRESTHPGGTDHPSTVFCAYRTERTADARRHDRRGRHLQIVGVPKIPAALSVQRRRV